IGSVGEGFCALFAFVNGMGLPLLAVGLLGVELLPRAGNWMNTVKAVAGVILLAVALVFLERMPSIFPVGLTTFLWAALFIISAIYMGAIEPIKEGSSGWSKLRKGLAVIILIYGAVFFLASLTGGSGDLKDPLHGSKLAGTSGAVVSGTTSDIKSKFTLIKTVDDLQAELAKGKPVMLDFYADWCVYCKTYEKYVFTDPKVSALMSKFNLVQADVTANDAKDQALLKHTGVFLPPAILFYDPKGQEVRALRVIGEMDARQFQAQLEKVLASF
ncbi:MAG: thioredoxin family protein, partial [Gammaproteobacteria bacterium]|nr:thioredoxin family protein [Gammaproteobacteria bacterium]